MAGQVVSSVEVSEFKSPPRILARSFRISRDNWKQKYTELKTKIKRFKNQAYDARQSREQWKEKAQSLEADLRRLKEELEQHVLSAEKKRPAPRQN